MSQCPLISRKGSSFLRYNYAGTERSFVSSFSFCVAGSTQLNLPPSNRSTFLSVSPCLFYPSTFFSLALSFPHLVLYGTPFVLYQTLYNKISLERPWSGILIRTPIAAWKGGAPPFSYLWSGFLSRCTLSWQPVSICPICLSPPSPPFWGLFDEMQVDQNATKE